MLALAKFWLPFQKWRTIGKKRRQNGYMLKNRCFSSVSLFNEQIILKAGVFSGSDLAATIVIAFKWFEDVSWILMDSRRSDVQPASTKTFFWANDRSNWEADWQISQNILPPAEAVCDVVDADSDAGTNFSQGLFFCHEGRKAHRRSSFSYFACFSPASLFFFAWLEAPIRHPNIATCCFHDQLSSHVLRLNAAVHQRNNSC